MVGVHEKGEVAVVNRIGPFIEIDGVKHLVVRQSWHGASEDSRRTLGELGWGYVQKLTKAGKPTGREIEVRFFKEPRISVESTGRRYLSKTYKDLGGDFQSLARNGSRSLDTSIKIREDFYDKPHSRQQQVKWSWPEEMIEVGDCEAILYTSNKWQKNGAQIDYKHVKEGEQKLLLRPDIALTGDADEMFGPEIDLKGEFPDSFAVLAKSISIQARLYSDDSGKKFGDYVDMKFSGSTLGAGKFDDGGTFCFVYDSTGVLAVVIGEKLDVLKDGIVG